MPSDSEDELHPLLPGSPASRKRSPLGVMGLAVLSYFSVCGGPFGLEVAIAAGGPAPVVASILTLALLWAMPVALMTSELGSALPSRGGYMYWVERAFGRRLGAVNGWFSICTALLDSSSYPAMFCGYVTFALARWTSQPPLSELQRWAVSAALTCTVCALNLRGISLAARASIALACISMGPFVILLGLSLRDDPAALLGAPLGWVRALAGGGAAAAATAAPAVPGAAAAPPPPPPRGRPTGCCCSRRRCGRRRASTRSRSSAPTSTRSSRCRGRWRSPSRSCSRGRSGRLRSARRRPSSPAPATRTTSSAPSRSPPRRWAAAASARRSACGWRWRGWRRAPG